MALPLTTLLHHFTHIKQGISTLQKKQQKMTNKKSKKQSNDKGRKIKLIKKVTILRLWQIG